MIQWIKNTRVLIWPTQKSEKPGLGVVGWRGRDRWIPVTVANQESPGSVTEMCECLRLCMCHRKHIWQSKDNHRSQVFPSTMQIPWIKLRLSSGRVCLYLPCHLTGPGWVISYNCIWIYAMKFLYKFLRKRFIQLTFSDKRALSNMWLNFEYFFKPTLIKFQ